MSNVVKFLDLSSQYLKIKSEIDNAIQSVLEESAFIKGPHVSEFESNFSKYCDAEYAVGVGNGTDALEIALEALSLPAESEVIVPANSFIATSEAVTRVGLKVVFCECDKDNYTISIKDLKSKINKNTSAIIAVHLYGHPCDMGQIMDIASLNKLAVIEDCAQAHGAEFNGRRVGSIADLSTFSFYPGKNLGAYGDGGAITTNSKDLEVRCRMIANHGRVEKYNHKFEGRNSRLDGLQAAVLKVKLKHLDEWTRRRIEIADFYSSKLEGIQDLVLPKRESWARQVYHLFVIRVPDRDALAEYLRSNGIQTGIHYPISLPRLDAYKYMNCESFEYSDRYSHEIISLPIGEHLSDADINHVVVKIKDFFSS